MTVSVALQKTPAATRQAIEAELQKHGDPLRWAVTSVNLTEQTAIIEAIITREEP
jgi:hypothetical protein